MNGTTTTKPAAEVTGTNDGRDVALVAACSSPAREINLAAVAALGAGLDPVSAAMRQREVIVDRLLAELAAGSAVAIVCRDCGARFEGRAYQLTPCPRCGEVDVVEAGRVA